MVINKSGIRSLEDAEVQKYFEKKA